MKYYIINKSENNCIVTPFFLHLTIFLMSPHPFENITFCSWKVDLFFLLLLFYSWKNSVVEKLICFSFLFFYPWTKPVLEKLICVFFLLFYPWKKEHKLTFFLSFQCINLVAISAFMIDTFGNSFRGQLLKNYFIFL